MKVYLNGDVIDAKDAAVSPFDAGYMYGDGVFDTLRTYSGFCFLLNEHLQRLVREAELLQIPFDPDFDTWRGRIESVLRANGLLGRDASIRIQISRGGGPDVDQVLVDPDIVLPVVFITAQPVSDRVEQLQKTGARILSMQSTFARGNFPQIKSLNYLPSIMAQRFARAQGYDEACLVNRQSKVLECSTSNIFLVHGNVLRTPSPRLGLLPGITRGHVMGLATSLGLKVEEAASDLRDLVVADEIFLTGSVKEVVPVVGLDSGAVGGGLPGPWTRQLQVAYKESIEATRGARAAEG